VLLACFALTACQRAEDASKIGAPTTSAAPSSRIYTFNADFDTGTLDNVNHDAPNSHQIQLNQRMTVEPYLWVANWVLGTVTKIDTRTGLQVAKYDSVLQMNWDGSTPVVRPPREEGSFGSNEPCGNTPSRTAVDAYGDAYVANRTFCGYPSATKYAGDPSRCVDRNGNGQIDTSRDANGDGLVNLNDPAEFKGQADECILWTKNYGQSGGQGRSMAVDSDQNVWVGTYVDSKLFKLDGQTGALLQTLDPNAETGRTAYIYGIAIGPGGFIYTSDLGAGRLRKIDPNPAVQEHVVDELQSSYGTYGIAVDRNGVVWLGKWSGENGGGIVRADFATGTVTYPGEGTAGGCSGYTRGVAVDGDGNVWAACWRDNVLLKFAGDGSFLGSWPVAAGPIGVGIDADGKVWTVNQASDSATRFDPTTGTVQSFPTSGEPYSYSDMTGFQQRNVTLRQGHWTAVHDSGVVSTRWGTVTWNAEPQGSTPPGTSIIVEVRAADDQLQLPALPFVAVSNGVEFGGVQGRYVEVRATLKIQEGNTSPVLSDLRIEPANVAPEAICKALDVCTELGVCFANANINNGSFDPDGDPITLAQLPPGPYSVGSRDVTLVVSDGVESDMCTAPVTVRDCEPPAISCPPPVTRECVAGGAVVDMAPATASDNCAVASVTDPPQATYPVGTTSVPYTAVDVSGLSASCTSAVIVQDTQPPTITSSMVELWPPNHKPQPFTLSSCATVTDSCQGTIDINAAGTITAIYSDEPEDVTGNGDGHTTGDIAITGRSSFSLRSERQGGGNGRVYGVSFRVIDAAGNVSTGSCRFVVPHDQSGRPAVDDGPGAGYTVTAP
jgi:sugar lactone lactonase YvrE